MCGVVTEDVTNTPPDFLSSRSPESPSYRQEISCYNPLLALWTSDVSQAARARAEETVELSMESCPTDNEEIESFIRETAGEKGAWHYNEFFFPFLIFFLHHFLIKFVLSENIIFFKVCLLT